MALALTGRPAGAPAVPDSSGMRVLRTTRIVSIGIVVAGVALWTAVPALRGRDVAPLAMIALFLGVPHGTVDLLLPQSDTWRRGPAAIGWILGLYLLAAVVAIPLVLFSPVLAYYWTLMLSVFHWGDGDARLRRDSGGQPAGPPGIIEILAYGGVGVIAVAFWPDNVQRLLAVIGPGVARSTHLPSMIGAVLILCAMGVFAVRMAIRRQWLTAVEMLALAALSILTPPLVSFALYFGLWHSLRQTVRLVVDARANTASAGSQLDSARLPRMMVAGTAGTFVFIGAAIAVTARYSGHTTHFHAGEWMIAALFAVITPHAVVVLRYELWKARHAELRSPGTTVAAVLGHLRLRNLAIRPGTAVDHGGSPRSM